MKFIDFLNSVDGTWEGDVSTENFESPYTFVWDSDVAFTPAGKKYFAKILNSQIKIPRNDLVILLSKDITEVLFDYFSDATAGYIPNSQYEKYFKEKKR
jgi:hypothetical protein